MNSSTSVTLGFNDIIYEIGPGKGIITERLAQRCRQVIAIEKDPLLVDALRAKFALTANIRLHEGDFLEYWLPSGRYKYLRTSLSISQVLS